MQSSPLPLEAAETFEALEVSERLLIVGCRTWVVRRSTRSCPLDELDQLFAGFGVLGAAAPLDVLLCAAARTAFRPIEVHCPRCRKLSDDETRLLCAVAVGQADDLAQASRQLAHWLPSAVADWACGPVCGLGLLFAQAGLVLPQRLALASDGMDGVNGDGGRRCTLH